MAGDLGYRQCRFTDWLVHRFKMNGYGGGSDGDDKFYCVQVYRKIADMHNSSSGAFRKTLAIDA